MYAFSQHSPTPDEFADLIADSLAKRGAFSGEFRFDRSKFAILISDSDIGRQRKICLSQLYREYCAGDVVTRQKILMSASTRSNIQGFFEPMERSSNYVSEIVPRWAVEQKQLSTFSNAGLFGNYDTHHEIFADHFATLFSEGNEVHREASSDSIFESVSANDVLFRHEIERSIEKLTPTAKRHFEPLVHDDTGEIILHMSTCRDKFETARVLFSSEIEQLNVRGERLVFIIGPNNLLVTGSECERGLMYAHSELKSACKSGAVYPPVPLLFRDGEYYRYSIPQMSLWHKFFRELELHYLRDTYREQTRILQDDALWREAGYDLLDFDVSRSERGVLRSTCEIHARALPTLVPFTDYVYMFDRGGLAASASMDRVRLTCPSLMQETGFYPTRFLISKWPSVHDLLAIGHDQSI